jgi:hypothetical protein
VYRKPYSHSSSQFCFEWRGHAAIFRNVPVQWTVRRNRHQAEAAFEHTNADLTASDLPTGKGIVSDLEMVRPTKEPSQKIGHWGAALQSRAYYWAEFEATNSHSNSPWFEP